MNVTSMQLRVTAASLTACGIMACASTATTDVETWHMDQNEVHFATSQRGTEIRSITSSAHARPLSKRGRLIADLRAIRASAIAKGLELKSADEIRAEVEEARELGA